MDSNIGSLITNVEGTFLTTDEKELLSHPLIGGVILFARNYESPAQLHNLCRTIRALRKRPYLIMVDQEGGRVQRFLEGFTRLPAFSSFGQIYDQHPEKALRLAEECAWLMAIELLNTGVDLSLSPVLDLNKGKSTIIGERAFHADPKAVIALGHAFIKGMQKAGMASVGKHFPGHGHIEPDSHLTLPIDNRSWNEIYQTDLQPFIGLIAQDIPALMAAHIVFAKIDSLPVSYSGHWLHDILRKQMKFQGIIFSDDLNMEGANISAHYGDRFSAAREAGCDLILLCNNQAGVIEVLDACSRTTERHLIPEARLAKLQPAIPQRTACSAHINIVTQQIRDRLAHAFGK